MDTDEVWTAVDAQRLAVADLLARLSEDEWARPSLCAGWTVRDVAGHLASQYSTPMPVILSAMMRARGSVDRASVDLAVRHAQRPTSRLVDEIRGLPGSRRHPRVVSHLEVLTDILVHGMDIAVPLGRDYPVPAEASVTSVARVWSAPWHLRRAFPSVRRYDGFRLVATDADWAHGEGPAVEAPVAMLLLLLTGRDSAALPRLDGDGAGALRSRLAG